jgi:DNA-3-methyladenine glycosylase
LKIRNPKYTKLPLSFYQHDNVVQIAKDLLGKFLFTNIRGEITGGMIVETEAYKGPEDRGSHAYMDRKTERNKIMYEAGGVAYVYICYGIHDMFNVVTNNHGSSHAILIRAVEPVDGIDIMLKRREKEKFDHSLAAGPGALGKALGITKALNGKDLRGNEVWIEDHHITIPEKDIIASPRVGMNFEGDYKVIPWRFRIRGNKFSSKAK